MTERLSVKDIIEFDSAGALARPGPIGRLLRLGFGLLLGLLVWQMVDQSGVEDLFNLGSWFWVAFGLVLTPYVVNIGFGRNFGAWPRYLALGLAAGVAGLGWLLENTWTSELLWTVLTLWTVYLYTHLALCFVLAAIIATPGCEMRSIPQLFGRLRKQAAQEHYCPGIIDNIDRWEAGRSGASEVQSKHRVHASVRNQDLTGRGRHLLLHYGLPFLALNLAGNFRGPNIAYFGAAVPVAWMGGASVLNAFYCRRVHSHFTGPWLLAAAGAMLAQRLDWNDVGAQAWQTITYGAFLGAIVLVCGAEAIWGKYFGAERTADGESNS